MDDVEMAEPEGDTQLAGTEDAEAPAERKLYRNRQADVERAEDEEEEAPAVAAVPTKIDWTSAPPAPSLSSGADLRGEAVLVVSNALLDHDMTTPAIMRWVNKWTTDAKGIEWISDISFVIVFPSPEQALDAISALFVAEDAEAEGDKLRSAIDRLSDLYSEPQPEDIDRIRTAKPIRSFAEEGDEPSTFVAGWGRIALLSDVKPKRAAESSKFYARHGKHAGKAKPLLADRLGGRARREPGDNRDAELERLDAELDAIRNRDEEDGVVEPTSGARRRSPPPRRDRRRSLDEHERERQRQLDDELDSYAAARDEPREAPEEPQRPQQEGDLFLASLDFGGSLRSVWDTAGPLTAEERGEFTNEE